MESGEGVTGRTGAVCLVRGRGVGRLETCPARRGGIGPVGGRVGAGVNHVSERRGGGAGGLGDGCECGGDESVGLVGRGGLIGRDWV